MDGLSDNGRQTGGGKQSIKQYIIKQYHELNISAEIAKPNKNTFSILIII